MTTNQFFPFYSLGFRCNPFRALTDEEWVEVAVIPSSIQETLNNGYTNLQIVGEKGYGKTTILLIITAELKQSNRNATYEYIPENGRAFYTSLANLDHFLLDEVQRLTQNERKRLLSYSGRTRLILATHEDLTPLFTANNLPLTTIYLNKTGSAHLKAVLNNRLSYFSLEDTPPITFSDQDVQFLWNKFGRDFRAAEHYLYEYFQQLLTNTNTEDRLISLGPLDL